MKKKDRDDIPGLVKSINEEPDLLHLDYTPSVLKLSECGTEAAIAILPLLDSKDKTERLRAQRVLEGVIKRRFGWKMGQGFSKNSKGQQKMETLILENGNYRYDAPLKERRSSAAKWKQWLAQNKDTHEE